MPKLTIDGKKIEVPAGTRVIEAAKKLGIDIPYYCYHPGLSIAGNCRMCLVEIGKMPKLQIACYMEAADGMVVKTGTEQVLATRRHVLEFLLVNHPLDCPVCDQAGECWLQDYYMRYGVYDSRVNENKVKKPKAVPIGPAVMLDAERCILCSRCVRFTDEISKTSELGIVNRGDHSEIAVFPGKELNNVYAGNVVDICPVGALTDRDFRFKMRVWYLKSADSLCSGCARGCNIQVQYNLDRPHHTQGERVMRLKPRFNPAINKWWICDEGRYGYKFHDKNRIRRPMIRKDGRAQEVDWEAAIALAAENISLAEGKIGIFLSPQLSNEELYLAKKLFWCHPEQPSARAAKSLSEGSQNEILRPGSAGSPSRAKSRDFGPQDDNRIYLVSPKPAGFQDDFLVHADKNPNSKGAEWMGFTYKECAVSDFFTAANEGKIEGIIVFGQDLLTLHGPHLAETALGKLKWSVFIGANGNLMSESAALVLPSATYVEKEGTFTNFEGRVQKFNKVLEPLGEARPEWQILVDLAKALGIHLHYDSAEEIFEELAARVKPFEGLTYEKLATGGTDIRVLAEPMIPELTQDSPLIFFETKAGQ